MCDGVSPMTGKCLVQAVAHCGAPSAAGLTGCRHSVLNAGYAGLTGLGSKVRIRIDIDNQ